MKYDLSICVSCNTRRGGTPIVLFFQLIDLKIDRMSGCVVLVNFLDVL